MKAVKVEIKGRVQGVSYRYYAVMRAVELGLKGYVKNMKNGSVEAVFCGSERAVRDMLEWCYKGPTMARVDDIIVNELSSDQEYSDFSIRHD